MAHRLLLIQPLLNLVILSLVLQLLQLDSLADGAGIKIGPDNTFLYDHSNTSLKSSENLNLASSKVYKIDGTDVLSATTLGSGVVNSSLTSLGTLLSLTVSGQTTLNTLGVTGVSTPSKTSREYKNVFHTSAKGAEE